MKSIKSKVIATLFALCFALLGYSCQCEAQEKYEVISVAVETKEDKGYESDKTYALVGGRLALNAVVETNPIGKAAKVNWSSNNENVTVDKNGLVTIKKGATAESVEITATSAKDETKSGSITLTPYSIDLTITSAKDSVSINKTLQLTATANSTPSDIPEVLKKVSWSSSDETIATVSDTGLITAKETEGSVTITATLPGGKTETKTLQVVLKSIVDGAILLSSDSQFTLSTANTTKNWKKADGTTAGYIEYCITNSGNDSDWHEWNGTAITAAKDASNPDPDKYYIFLRGKENAIIGGATSGYRFVITNNDAKVTLDGNMMNLLDYRKDYTNPANLTISGNNCFAFLFYSCAAIETLGPDFSLPATTLADYCYRDMFQGCTSLTSAPALPATTLADYCYAFMFQGCTSLTSAPALPATTLADHCYENMFYNCSSLTSAPALPATTLTDSCYSRMFQGCTSLTSAPALPATTLADYCYSRMFYDCTSLTSAPALPATTLADYCYQNMFYCCSSLKFSESETGEYTNEFKLGDATNATYAFNDMFLGTGGTFRGTPTGNRSYWTSNTIVPAN